MLSSLKKKLNSALQEAAIITENIKQQYQQRVTTPESLTSSRSSLVLSATDLGVPSNVNVAAGCNLLAKYEDEWKIIHQNNEENARKAQDVAKQIVSIETQMNQQYVVMSDLIHCLSAIPNLVGKLKDCQQTVKEVQELGHEVEKELEKLEDLCAECELQEYMLEKQCELSKFKQKKMEDLESYRQKVAADHQQRIRLHEEKLRSIQKERQAVFEDAFRHDLKEFKENGHISKIRKDIKQERSMSLEEVVLDDGSDTKDALEEFLNG
ncbi:dysbindin protein homolog [Stomoxys calcitrans]|uniref:Dysbindin protein homolog n=1 Tax=Stomoxys calcitrans TaxID=35570 RepID=A0A1I8P1C8_STOCA|nr:dysbindin protein homolog [Stomoxys calcitrans]